MRLRSVDWIAAATRPEAEVNSAIAGEIAREAITILLVALAGLVAAVLVSRRLTVPIKRLEQHATAIGHGEFGHQTDPTGPVELARLAGVINRMESEIRGREELLKDAQKRLHIALRTARMVAWSWDPVANRIETTDNFREIYGLPDIAESSQGFDLVHPDDLRAPSLGGRASRAR